MASVKTRMCDMLVELMEVHWAEDSTVEKNNPTRNKPDMKIKFFIGFSAFD
jgi:hypothetical protein